MIKDTTGIIQAGASATPANNFVLDASAANGTAKLYSGNAGTPVNTVLTVDAAGGITPLAPMHTAAVTPIFSAYAAVTTSLPSGVSVKVSFGTKDFDTTNAFDNVTNNRFTPQVAGYYQVSGCIQLGTTATSLYLTTMKNGTISRQLASTENATGMVAGSALVYLNGSTDYLELFCMQRAATQNNLVGVNTSFQAALIARV